MLSPFSLLSVLSGGKSLVPFGNIFTKRTDPTAQGYTSGQLYNYGHLDSVRTSFTGQYILCSAEANKKLLRSGDFGSTWTTLGSAAIPWLATQASRGTAISADGAVMYVGSTNGAIYKSTNYGVSWSALSTGNIVVAAIDCSADGTQLIWLRTGTGGGIYRSTDGGATISQIPTGSLNASTIQTKCWNVALSPDGSKIAVAATTWSSATGSAVGIWVSSNNASTFTNLGTAGISTSAFYASDVYISDAGDVWATAGYGINIGAIKYSVATSSWATFSLPLAGQNGITRHGGCSQDMQVMFVPVQLTNHAYCWYSTDGGATWTRVDSLGQSTWLASCVSPDGKLLAVSGTGTRGDLYISV